MGKNFRGIDVARRTPGRRCLVFKRNVLRSLVLVLALGLIFGFCVPFCFAEESVTITTYYPSPYGAYNRLQTNKFAVGDTDGNSQLSSGDQPPADGQLYMARSVIYKPQGDLEALANAKEGELAYKSSDKKFYFYNGSKWVPLVGGGCYVAYSVLVYDQQDEDYDPSCEGDDCCASGFTNEGSAGWFGTAVSSAYGTSMYSYCPDDDCEDCRLTGYCSDEGDAEAFVCCQ